MYSTSSSECECDDEYCTCDAGYGNQGGYRTPFYATMGHPLIYYAQVPPPSKRQTSKEDRRGNQNCFAKAFKWYTQEHVPHQNYSNNKMEVNAFAAWLDSKYDEFLRDSQLDNMYHIKMKRTSIIEADRIPTSTYCEHRSKRFRVKSPWRKKRHISKEAGDTIQKPNQSFQFILKPKELMRIASECQPSTATMASNFIPVKTTIKSQSYTLVTYEPEKTRSSNNKLNKADELKSAVDKGTSRNEFQNISCQCSTVKVEKTNAQSQYDSTGAETSGVMTCDNQLPRTNICCCSFQPCKNFIATPNNDVPKLVTTKVQSKVAADGYTINCQCSKEINLKADSQSQHQTDHMECEPSLLNIQSSKVVNKTCLCESEEVLKVENPIILSYPITFSNDSAQTSDHSIHLGNDTTHGYPLFMKIICADKLCK